MKGVLMRHPSPHGRSVCSRHWRGDDVRAFGPLRSDGQPDRSGDHELRLHRGRTDQLRGHGRRDGCGHQLLRHRRRYGGPQTPDMKKGYGIAEETAGRWLQRSGHRDDIVLATKVYQPMGLGPNDRRLSAYHIRRACEASLRRLRTDHIDLYQMHHVDRATPWEEIWQAMEQLVRGGKISYVGSSNFAGWDVALAQCAASARHFMGLTAEQSLYNLVVRTVELELIPALRSLGIGLIPYSPLHAGLLAGVLETAAEGRIFDDSTQQRIEAHRDQLEAYEGLCREVGAMPAEVALAWLLRNPVVSTTIVGATTTDELQLDLGALSVQLDAAVMQRLDQIWPGPGEAPQAYAW